MSNIPTGSTGNSSESARIVVVERVFPHSPAKVWRALTETSLLGQWLLENNFEPSLHHKFQFRADPMPHWNGVIDCRVLVLDPLRRLSYSWSSLGLESEVLFTLTPTGSGTHVRMEQSGFRPDQEAAYKGARFGWQKFFGNLEKVLLGVAV